jgi:hypothetical protein
MSDLHDDGGGALGAHLDRLREVTEELHAVLAGQRSDGTTGEKWLARISSLETRLSMVESTVRAEAERVQAAARNVDALAGTLRGALEGAESVAAAGRGLEGRLDRIDHALAEATPDVVALAAEVGRQVEAVVQGPTQEMTRALAEHLDRSSERERAVAGALDSLTGQLNQFTATLAAEVRRSGQEAVSASRTELEGTGRQIAELTARTAGLSDLAPRIDFAIAGIAAVRDDLAATAAGLDQSARLDALTEATARVDARVAQTSAIVGQGVRDALAEDRAATVGPVVERLGAIDGIRNDLVGLRESLFQRLAAVDVSASLEPLVARVEELAARPATPDVVPHLDVVREAILELTDHIAARPATPDPTPHLEELRAAVAALSELADRPPPPAPVVDLTPALERLELLRAHVEQLGASTASVAERMPADPAPALDDVAAQLVEVRHTLNRTSAATALDSLREDLDALRLAVAETTTSSAATTNQAVAALGGRLDGLLGTVEDLGARLDAVSARPDASATLGVPLQELRAEVGAIAESLAPVADVPAAVRRLHDELEGLAAVPAAIDGLSGAVEGAAVVQRRSAGAVEALQAELQALRAEVGAAAAGSQHVGHRVDEVATQLTEAARTGAEAQEQAAQAIGEDLARRLDALDRSLADLAARPGAEAALDPVLDRLATSNDAITTLLNGVETVGALLAAVRAEVAASRTEVAEAAAGTQLRLAALDEVGGAVARVDARLGEQAGRPDRVHEVVVGIERIEEDLSALADAVGAVVAGQSQVATGADLERVAEALQAASERAASSADLEGLLDGVVTELRAVLASAPPLTQAQLTEALAAFGATLTEGPAPIAASDLRDAVEAFRASVDARPPAPSADAVAAAVQAALPPAPPGLDPDEVAAAVLAALPAPPTIDAGQLAVAVAAAVPTPPHLDPDEVAAAVRAAIPAPVTLEQLASGLARLKADLADGGPDPLAVSDAVLAALPAVVTGDQLRTALADLQASMPPSVTASDLELLASRVTGAVSAATAGARAIGPDELELVATRITEAVGAAAARSVGPDDLDRLADRIVAAVAAATADIPSIGPDDLQLFASRITGAVGAASASSAGVGPDDLDLLGERVIGAVREAAAGVRTIGPDDLEAVRVDTTDAVRQAVAASTAELRAELGALQGAVAEVAALRPEPVALPPDPRPAIDAVATAVEEARRELQAIAARQEAAAATSTDAAEPAAPAVAGPDPSTVAQLDALGRLVHHAVRSLHLIEAATVGVSPKTERARAAATAALRDLESARRP